MATTRINDDAIWLKNIESGEELRKRIREMRPGDLVDLEVDGVVGRWERMRNGKDGRPTLAIKPVAEMREVWARLQHHRGKVVTVREVLVADAYLASLRGVLNEWESAEDEKAYRDL